VTRDVVIRVRDLSKTYDLYAHAGDLLKELLFRRVRHDVFSALSNVSFDVREGDRLGIIGRNGAGKSTLLKIITGNLHPTSGSVEVRGTISAMLSLTSFLMPEETGLDNIKFNLLVGGHAKADIPRLTEEIIEFTELGAFIYAPVKTYSSGMNARLAFAISTVVSPDILVVDEVLGAGDSYFVGKATQRMAELTEQGRALLFVSHSLRSVQALCSKALWLDDGSVRAYGSVGEVTRAYEEDYRRHEDQTTRSGNRQRRASQVNRVQLRELGRDDVVRLRLTGAGGDGLHDAHYVRSVRLRLAGQSLAVPLEFTDIDRDDADAALDVVLSEWGRLHTRRGVPTRALSPSSALFRGGHVLVRRPEDDGGEALPVEVEVESTSLAGDELLGVEYADLESLAWVPLALQGRSTDSGGWTRGRFAGPLPARPTATCLVALRERLLEDATPDVEIHETVLLVDGRRSLSVLEHQPFTVAVTIVAHRPVRRADVGIKIMRRDGVYVFWQSSDLGGAPLRELCGGATVRFRFDPNLIGAGEYVVSCYVANGLDFDDNYPYSEVYAREVDDLEFSVEKQRPMVDFGIVNQRVPVEVEIDSREPAP
jgi:lipopolysaccharide transport system ATP-binding protein